MAPRQIRTTAAIFTNRASFRKPGEAGGSCEQCGAGFSVTAACVESIGELSAVMNEASRWWGGLIFLLDLLDLLLCGFCFDLLGRDVDPQTAVEV